MGKVFKETKYSHRLKGVNKNKPHKNLIRLKFTVNKFKDNTILLTVNELSTDKLFIAWAAKLNQHKGILISKFESNDMLLLIRDSSFVFTENENLWIVSKRIWFERPWPPERLPWTTSEH